MPIDLQCVVARKNRTTRENDSFLQGRHVDKRTINSHGSIKPRRRLPRSILCRVKSDIESGIANALKHYALKQIDHVHARYVFKNYLYFIFNILS